MSTAISPSRLDRFNAGCFIRRLILGLTQIADAEATARRTRADALTRVLAEREIDRLMSELQLAPDLYVDSRIRADLGATPTEEIKR